MFPVDDILLGPAAFGRLHRLDGWIWHTGEEPKFTRDYAVSTAIWQRTNPGSYNFRVYDEDSAGSRGGVMLNVPYLEASGGINPSSAAWSPGRFPFLERELAKAGPCSVRGCPGPYRNPTMHHLQGSFVGTTAALNAGQAPANYVPDALALIAWSEGLSIRGKAPLVHSKHGHWQSNRSDCGDWMYTRLVPQSEDDMPIVTRPVREKWRIPAGTPFWVGGPGFGTEKRFTVDIELWSNGETEDGQWRRLEFENSPGAGEELWIARGDATPISGTRNPSSGFGSPSMSGVPKATYEAALERIAAKDAYVAKYPKG